MERFQQGDKEHGTQFLVLGAVEKTFFVKARQFGHTTDKENTFMPIPVRQFFKMWNHPFLKLTRYPNKHNKDFVAWM